MVFQFGDGLPRDSRPSNVYAQSNDPESPSL